MTEKLVSKFTPEEARASALLACLFAVRMLGLFLITPVFAKVAYTLANGNNLALVGLALGAYGITQAIMQIPMGMLSDRLGRRTVVVFGLLLFIIGGAVCAISHSVTGVMIGRFIQGSGAISAAIVAWIADSTRPEVRTRAMAMSGSSIGLAFALSLVLSPVLLEWVHLSGIFWTISALGLVCLMIAIFMIPEVPLDEAVLGKSSIREVLRPDLLRLDLSVFTLHFCMMSLFVVAPRILGELTGLDVGGYWRFYLPVIVIALLVMVPCVIAIERHHQHRVSMLLCIVLLMVVLLFMPRAMYSAWGFGVALTIFFIIFNVMEAILPSAVSRIVQPNQKGLALGVFNMSQSLGVAAGGAMGGWAASMFGVSSVYTIGMLLSMAWYFAMRGFKALR